MAIERCDQRQHQIAHAHAHGPSVLSQTTRIKSPVCLRVNLMQRHFSSKHRLVYILFALELRIQHILLPLLSSASELVRNTCHCRRRDRLWSLACAALLSFFWYCSMRFILTTFTCKTVIQSLCWYHERGHVYSRIHLRHSDGIRYT